MATATIQGDGSYTMRLGQREGLPLGDYKVYVRPPLPGSQEHFRRRNVAAPADSGTSTKIPEKYQFESSSGLTASVKSGENKFDFDLVD